MSKRKVYHVVPNSKVGWDVKLENSKRVSAHTDTKAAAVDLGRDLAKKNDLGQLKIHKTDGKIQTEHTYRKDPYPPKG